MILLIDDDDDEYEFFTRALQEMNGLYGCWHARNVREGMEVLVATMPEIIFIDLNLPGINGWEGLQLMQRRELIKDIPVVLYSTWVTEGTVEKGSSMGAFACLQKQTTVPGLVNALHDIFSRC